MGSNWAWIQEQPVHKAPDLEWLYRYAVDELGFAETLLAARLVDFARNGVPPIMCTPHIVSVGVTTPERRLTPVDCLDGSALFKAISSVVRAPGLRFRPIDDGRHVGASSPLAALTTLAEERNRRSAELVTKLAIPGFDDAVEIAFRQYSTDVGRYHHDECDNRAFIEDVDRFALPPLPGLAQGEIEEHLTLSLLQQREDHNFTNYERLRTMCERYVFATSPYARAILNPDRPAANDLLIETLCRHHGYCPTCASGAIELAFHHRTVRWEVSDDR